MKKIIVIAIILFCVNPVYSQDVFKELQKQTLLNDSLQKQVNLLNNTINELKNTNESLTSTNQELIKLSESEQNNFKAQIESYKFKIAEINKSKIKIELDTMIIMRDLLLIKNSELESTISENKLQITQNQQLCEETKRKEYEKGKLELINQLAEFYNKPFNDLITSSSIKIVERDMIIFGNNAVVKQKLLDLKKYFNSEQVLQEKYNEQNVLYALNQIVSLEKSERVKYLSENLNNYKLSKDGLYKSLIKIIEIDKKQFANDDYTQNVKMKNILIELELSSFFRNYRFNFTNYPYLTEIILEIIKLKQKDANAEIKYLIDKL